MSLQTKTPGAGKQPGATIESGRRKFTASHLARGIACGLLVSASAFFTGVVLTRCTSHASHGTMSPALKSAGAEHTIEPAVASPTVSGLLSRLESLTGTGISGACQQGFGRDEPIRKDGCTAGSVCSTSRPPYALEQAAGGFQSQPGA